MWEYDRKKIEFKTVQDLLDELNTLGMDGWEIIYYQETKPKKFGGNYKSIVLLKKMKTNML